MKIHYCSDLHLEMNHNWPSFIEKSDGGDCLILAGDIMNTPLLKSNRNDSHARKAQKKMIKLRDEFFSKYKHVLYVIGNHEHYGGVIYNTIGILRKFLKENNFKNTYVLENQAFQLSPELCVLGATLWTDINKGDPIAAIDIELGMRDYHAIFTADVHNMRHTTRKDNPHLLTSEHTREMHRVSRDWIFSYCKRFKKVIVATHHAPSWESADKNKNKGYRRTGDLHLSPLTAAYCSNLDNLILENQNITHWIHGHTHYNIHYKIGNTQVTSAMYGYQTFEPTLVNNFHLGSLTL